MVVNVSCGLCEEIQDMAFNKNIPETIGIAYIRVGTANMAIVGCQKHVKMLIEINQKYDDK